MVSEIYTGLVIGGPAAGRHITCRAPFFRAPVLSVFDPWKPPSVQPADAVKTVEYRFDEKSSTWILTPFTAP